MHTFYTEHVKCIKKIIQILSALLFFLQFVEQKTKIKKKQESFALKVLIQFSDVILFLNCTNFLHSAQHTFSTPNFSILISFTLSMCIMIAN